MPALAVLLLALAAPAAPQDQVRLLDGGLVTGRIESATLEEIRVRQAGSEQVIPAREVLELRFGPGPASLRRAEDFLASLDFQNAANLFRTAAGEDGPPWLEAWALLRRAECLLAWAELDEARVGDAEEAFAQWLERWPDHFYVPRARIGHARALALAGKVAEAASELEALASLAFEKNLGKHLELEAQLQRCRVFLAGGQAQVAEARLQDLVPELAKAASDPDQPAALRPKLAALLAEARIALGESIRTRGGEEAARKYWENLLAEPRLDPEVAAAARVGLAEAARAAGQPRKAQLLLARVIGVSPARGEVMARALFLMGEVCRELGGDVASPTPYYQEVVDRYPGTRWAVEARRRLQG